MHENILEAFERIEGPKELRKTGCVPGVLYGEGYEKGIPVAFEESELTKIINLHGANAKVIVDFNGNQKLGFIKELQRNNLTKKIIHSDVFVTSQDHKIRMKLPVLFNGISELERRNLILQINSNHMDISGEASVLPEFTTVNVGSMQAHDAVKIKDIKLDNRIKVYDVDELILATVVEAKGFNEGSEISPKAEETLKS